MLGISEFALLLNLFVIIHLLSHFKRSHSDSFNAAVYAQRYCISEGYPLKCTRLIHHVWKEHSKPRQSDLGRPQPFWLLNCSLSRMNAALRWLSAQYADFRR